MTFLKKAITIQLAYSNLGDVLRALEKYDEAIVKYEEALVLNPKLAEAYYGWGMVLKNKGDIKGAKEKLEAVELDPDGETGKKAKKELDKL